MAVVSESREKEISREKKRERKGGEIKSFKKANQRQN